jgi:hypothetical protein
MSIPPYITIQHQIIIVVFNQVYFSFVNTKKTNKIHIQSSFSLSQVYFFLLLMKRKKNKKKTRVEKPNERTFVLSHGISTFSLLGIINEKRKMTYTRAHTLKRKLIQCVTKRKRKQKSYINMRMNTRMYSLSLSHDIEERTEKKEKEMSSTTHTQQNKLFSCVSTSQMVFAKYLDKKNLSVYIYISVWREVEFNFFVFCFSKIKWHSFSLWFSHSKKKTNKHNRP